MKALKIAWCKNFTPSKLLKFFLIYIIFGENKISDDKLIE